MNVILLKKRRRIVQERKSWRFMLKQETKGRETGKKTEGNQQRGEPALVIPILILLIFLML